MTAGLCFWMNMPSHHQSEFFEEIARQGVDLQVCYYGSVGRRRSEMGWSARPELNAGERYVVPDLSSLESLPQWRSRVHVIPGYGHGFLRSLIKFFCRVGVRWVHWSEPSHPGVRWYLTYGFKRRHAHRVNNHALGALACGNLAADDFARWGIRRDKIAFLPYAPRYLPASRSDRLEQLLRDVSGKKIFLYVGSLEQRKGIDLLLRAFADMVRETGTDQWILVVVGSDRSRGRYQRFVHRSGIQELVHFVGPVPIDEIGAFHATADVLVLPSRFDGWGAVLNESAAHGTALIATERCGAASHLVKNAINGYVVRCDWRSLREAMRIYATSDVLVHSHGLASALIYKDFTPERTAQRLIAILNSWSLSERAAATK